VAVVVELVGAELLELEEQVEVALDQQLQQELLVQVIPEEVEVEVILTMLEERVDPVS